MTAVKCISPDFVNCPFKLHLSDGASTLRAQDVENVLPSTSSGNSKLTAMPNMFWWRSMRFLLGPQCTENKRWVPDHEWVRVYLVDPGKSACINCPCFAENAGRLFPEAIINSSPLLQCLKLKICCWHPREGRACRASSQNFGRRPRNSRNIPSPVRVWQHLIRIAQLLQLRWSVLEWKTSKNWIDEGLNKPSTILWSCLLHSCSAEWPSH